MDLLLYVPAHAAKPVPLLLNVSFSANSNTVDDPGVKVGEVWGPDKKKIPASQGRRFGKMDVARLIDAGFGFGNDLLRRHRSGFPGGMPYGVRAHIALPDGPRPTNGARSQRGPGD